MIAMSKQYLCKQCGDTPASEAHNTKGQCLSDALMSTNQNQSRRENRHPYPNLCRGHLWGPAIPFSYVSQPMLTLWHHGQIRQNGCCLVQLKDTPSAPTNEDWGDRQPVLVLFGVCAAAGAFQRKAWDGLG